MCVHIMGIVKSTSHWFKVNSETCCTITWLVNFYIIIVVSWNVRKKSMYDTLLLFMCAVKNLTLIDHVHGEVTPLSSRTLRARQKNLFFLSCITKMDQDFINVFSWVDIYNIYYILKIHDQIWRFVFLIKHTVSNYNDAELN